MTPGCGLIEGFFGPPWPEAERLAMAPFLQALRFDHYIYAPKADPFLRKKWREPWPAEFRERLVGYSRHFRAHGVKFGVGLSPFELHGMGTQEGKQLLQAKVRQLDDLGLDVLGLFFDDFPVNEDLAAKQLEAIDVIHRATRARIVFCPSFYSTDRILEKVFGKRPERYFEEIRMAPAEVEFAWTGPKVISAEIPAAHLREAAGLLGRKPFLWDNLFANDGPRNCRFLKLRAPRSPSAGNLALTSGWAFNPMNQPALSRLAVLAAKHALVDDTEPLAALECAIAESCSSGLGEWVGSRRDAMLDEGLDGIPAERKEQWRGELERWPGEPVAGEVRAWLAGEYLVGDECLTD